MKGIILLWYGTIAALPFSWHICDGTHGTPDLRNRLPIPAGDTYNPTDNGGNASHNHSFTSDLHDHFLRTNDSINALPNASNTTTSVAVTGTTDLTANLPPFYALSFIQKL